VVGTSTLVASSSTRASSESSPEATCESATRGAASSTTHSWVGAVAGQVTSETAGVATTAGTSSTQTQSWAVSLDVPESLAVIALLGYAIVSLGSGVARGMYGKSLGLDGTYSRWCGDAGIRWTRGLAACLVLISICVVLF
jgi:hypothetical protein